MTKKATPPSFIEGWERIPGANNYEINAEAIARHSGSKKIISSAPDAEGNVLIFGNEKRLEKFNLRKIADELFGKEIAGVKMETEQGVKIQKGERIIQPHEHERIEHLPETEQQKLSQQILEEADQIENQQSKTTQTMERKNTAKKKGAKKAPKKAAAPKKAQSPKAPAKTTPAKEKAHAKAESGKTSDALVQNIKKNAETLKTGVVDEAKLKAKKAEIEKIMEADTFGHEKIYMLDKAGFTQPEISKITGKRKEVVQRDIWLYTTGKKKLK